MRWQIELTHGLGGWLVRARRAARGPWLNGREIPEFVRSYCQVDTYRPPTGAAWWMDDAPKDREAMLALIAQSPEIKLQRGWPRVKLIADLKEPPHAPFMHSAVEIDLKWSLWSADIETFHERAPYVAGLLEVMSPHQGITIHTAPRKEIRFGTVTVSRTSGLAWEAYGCFRAEWDDVSSLMDTLNVPDQDRSMFEEACPYSDGEPGVGIEFDVKARSLRSLLRKVDAEEARLLDEENTAWAEFEKEWRHEA